MNVKNPIEMRLRLTRSITEKELSRDSAVLIAKMMKNTPENQREALAKELIPMIENMGEAELIKRLLELQDKKGTELI